MPHHANGSRARPTSFGPLLLASLTPYAGARTRLREPRAEALGDRDKIAVRGGCRHSALARAISGRASALVAHARDLAGSPIRSTDCRSRRRRFSRELATPTRAPQLRKRDFG